jgi:putative membrane protein
MQWWCAAQGVPWTWSWQPYPGVWAFCLGLFAIWARMRAKWPGAEETGRRAAIFLAGVATLWIALDWPVGALGAGYLASVHMVQYLLIALVAPPLLIIGTPRGAFDSLLSRPLGGFVRTLTHPIVSMTTFVSIMGVTHWPWLVDTWMATQLGSFGLDVLWLFSGLVFWWPVAAPAPAREWLTDGTRIGYLIMATLVNTGVFAYLAFTELPLYATYELAPPVGTISSRDDQLVAGLLMKVGGAPIIWTAITIVFFRAYAKSDSLGRREALSLPDAGRISVIALLVVVPLVGACGAGEPAEGGADEAAASETSGWTAAGPLEVRAARIGLPPLPDRAAGYLEIRNPGSAPLRIVGARPPDGVRSASIHATETSSGMMSMGPAGPVEVPAGESVVFRPGGTHVMLDGIEAAWEVGSEHSVTLVLDDGREAVVRFHVVPLTELEPPAGD